MDVSLSPEEEQLCFTVAYRVWMQRRMRKVHWRELVTDAYLGLLDARQRFDPARGAKWFTFAKHRMRGAILDGVRADDELTRTHRLKLKAGDRTVPNVLSLDGHWCDAMHLGRSRERHVRQRIGTRWKPRLRKDGLPSLALTLYERRTQRLKEQHEARDHVRWIASRISDPRRRRAFELRAGGMLTQDIAQVLGVHPSRVSQLFNGIAGPRGHEGLLPWARRTCA